MFIFNLLKPKILVFFVTYKCNSRCIMCYIWQKQNNYKEMNLEEIERFFNHKLVSSNVEIINITGGEPTLRPDLDEIIKIILKSCFKLKRIDIPTNGINTVEVIDKIERILALLIPTSVKLSVTISLDGIGKKHEEIRRVPAIFEKVNQTIKELKELQRLYPILSVGLNTVISKYNYKNLQENLDYALKNNIGINFTLSALSEIGVESMSSDYDFILDNIDKNEKENIISFFNGLLKKRQIQNIYGRFIIDFLERGFRRFDCNFKRGRAFLIEPNGDIYMCGNFKEFKLGNIKLNNIIEIFENKKKFHKNIFNRCRTCNSNCYL